MGKSRVANLKFFRGLMDSFAQVWMCFSVLMIVALTFERHFAIRSPHRVSFDIFVKNLYLIFTLSIVASGSKVYTCFSIDIVVAYEKSLTLQGRPESVR